MMTEVDSLGAWTPTEEEEDVKERELWSLDMTLTDYILPRITAFRKMKRHGYPVEDITAETDVSDEEWKQTTDRAMADWENILFDIELAFKTLKDTEDNARTRSQHEDIKRGLALFAKHYEHLWD